MRLLETGRGLAEPSWRWGSAPPHPTPGHFKGRQGEGEGVSQAVWDPVSENKH